MIVTSSLRFQRTSLELIESPPRVALQDYPSVRTQPELAAAEVGRLTAMGEITWYPGCCHPLDLRMCPSQLIAKPDIARVAPVRAQWDAC